MTKEETATYNKLYRENNGEKLKEKSRLYGQNNKERIKLYKKENKERIESMRKQWYAKNRDKILSYRKERYKIERQNKDILNAKIRADRKVNPQKYREWDRRKTLRDKDKITERQRNWRKKNVDRFRANARRQTRAAYARNPEKIRERGKEYRERFPEKHKERLRSYRKRHPEVIRAIEVRKRCAGKVKPEDVVSLMKEQRGLCYYCSTDISMKYHIDHFLPIKLGGTSDVENLVLSCPTCNHKKSAKHPVVFLNELKSAV